MAVERKDMFGDGTVSMEYYPHKRVEMRVGGFKVVVAKPYGTRPVGCANRVYDKAVILMSANQTVVTDPRTLILINKAVNEAINMLNNENDGMVISKDFSINDCREVRAEDIPEEVIRIQKTPVSGQQTVNNIPYTEIYNNKVYQDRTGRKWVYIGKGNLYEKGNTSGYSENRLGCPYVYLSYDELNRYKWSMEGTTLHVSKCIQFIVDTYATKKKFIREVGTLPNKITELHSVNNNNILTFQALEEIRVKK